MKTIKCPNCGSKNLGVEKRLDGDAKCLDCHWFGKYSLCFNSVLKTPEQIIEEIERRLNENAAIPSRHYTEKHQGESNSLECLLSWITQENNLDERKEE